MIDEKLVELINDAQVVVVGKPNRTVKRRRRAAPRKAVLDKIAEDPRPLLDRAPAAICEIMSGSFFWAAAADWVLGARKAVFAQCRNLKVRQSVDYERLADIRGIFEEVSKGPLRRHVPVENSAARRTGIAGRLCRNRRDGLCRGEYGDSPSLDGQLPDGAD